MFEYRDAVKHVRFQEAARVEAIAAFIICVFAVVPTALRDRCGACC